MMRKIIILYSCSWRKSARPCFLCLKNYLKHIEHVRVITTVTRYRYRTVSLTFFPWLHYRVITHYPFSISISDYPVMGNVQLRREATRADNMGGSQANKE
jgi:hypothetical protein